jgi:hypothetical protein
MIPYEVDPSLHTGKPVEPQLDGGFSPPAPAQPPDPPALDTEGLQRATDDPLREKSGF